MHGIVVLTLVTVIAGVHSLPAVKPSLKADSIGQIGSKEYFEVDVGQKVYWAAAKQICNDEGLEFGSTETYAEFRFLYDVRKGKDYWVAASLRGLTENDDGTGTYKAFEWEDGTVISNGINFHQSSFVWQCLYFSGDDHTYVDLCSTGEHLVLCQKRHE